MCAERCDERLLQHSSAERTGQLICCICNVRCESQIPARWPAGTNKINIWYGLIIQSRTCLYSAELPSCLLPSNKCALEIQQLCGTIASAGRWTNCRSSSSCYLQLMLRFSCYQLCPEQAPLSTRVGPLPSRKPGMPQV